uniref:AIG1-type G domain-containing protein n=1 Tax=Neogobius melanostomus TaxID=47308 RepID=A0A8C6SKD6_9GOBI
KYEHACAADRRIVLLGKTGSGKSSLANTIIGVKDLFKVCHASTSGTAVCQFETRVVNGRRVQLIDTPGLYDTAPGAPDFNKEILNCMIECAPGVHAFLLVLKAERFTKQELSIAEAFTKNFSEEALRYTTVVFTQGDQLEEGMGLRDWVRDNDVLENLVRKCGGRCHVFDNKYWNNSQDPYRNNQRQVRELFNTIDQAVEGNRGRCYTNENLQRVQAKLRQEKEAIRATYMNMSERIIILGKTGTGKSSLANTIFGEKDSFTVSHRSISGTKTCVSKTKNSYGRNIQLFDTPGLFDTDPKSTELSPELLKCVTECAPGPHAFLLVLKVERYTRQEQAMIDVILKYFSEEALKYTTVVFTHGDQLPEGEKIEKWAKQNEALKTLLEKCGDRCHVFDNKHWDESQHPYRNNQYQVSELLDTIEQTVEENGGRCYTNDMIVLLGKTGSGKSSLANTILGETLFKVCHGAVSGTTDCQSEIRGAQERSVQLIDTPGFFDTDPDAPDMKKEVLNCMIECAPGVHTFLLVLKVERFTKHELAVADVFSQHFSEKALKYTTVVFTQGDQLEEGVTLKEWIKDNHALSTLVEKCGGRCHVFDNKYWKNSQDPYRSNEVQLKELFKTIDETVENNGGKCYTNENLKEVGEKLNAEKQSIKSNLISLLYVIFIFY